MKKELGKKNPKPLTPEGKTKEKENEMGADNQAEKIMAKIEKDTNDAIQALIDSGYNWKQAADIIRVLNTAGFMVRRP